MLEQGKYTASDEGGCPFMLTRQIEPILGCQVKVPSVCIDLWFALDHPVN